jgi:hypothetical protein
VITYSCNFGLLTNLFYLFASILHLIWSWFSQNLSTVSFIFTFYINTMTLIHLRKAIITSVIAGCFLTSNGQTSTKDVPHGWHLQDKKASGYHGISLDKAYQALQGKKSQPVIVAVIDSGIDTTHEDLRPVLWRNPKEIPGNGKDDDGNGYVDDIHGWNFPRWKGWTKCKCGFLRSCKALS